MDIYIGADHRGFPMKESIRSWLLQKGYSVTDCGNSVLDPEDDFTDFSLAVAGQVASSGGEYHVATPSRLGIVICGSGGGVCIAANKVRGIRCGQGMNTLDVIHNRKHDNINVLAIGSDFVTEGEAKSMIEAYLTTPFAGDDRLLRRLGKIAAYENSHDHSA